MSGRLRDGLAAFYTRGCPRLELLGGSVGSAASSATTENGRVVFFGVLSNEEEVRARTGAGLPSTATTAGVVHHAYGYWGVDVLTRMRGVYAVIIWDRTCDRLLCARDPAGMHPLFFATAGPALLLSPSIEAILGHPGVPVEINRIALAERLAGREPQADETYWTRIQRVLPGHALRIEHGCRGLHRYWDPAPPIGRWIGSRTTKLSNAFLRSSSRRWAAAWRSGRLGFC